MIDLWFMHQKETLQAQKYTNIQNKTAMMNVLAVTVSVGLPVIMELKK